MSIEVVLTFIGLALGGLLPGFLLARSGYVWMGIGYVMLGFVVTGVFATVSANTLSWDSLGYFILSAFGGVVTLAAAIGAGLGTWLGRRAAKVNAAHPRVGK